MVTQRSWKSGVFTMIAPYYDELLPQNGGFLSQDVPCHALWHYFLVAARALMQEKTQDIYEGEPDADFNAAAVFRAIALTHGVNPDDMIKYWSAVDAQAKMMGSDIVLPPSHRFNRRTVQ